MQESYLKKVPTFLLWYEQSSYVNSSILLRTRHVLLDHCSSTITMLLTTVLLLLCSGSSSLLFFFLSVYTIHCVFSFKSSPFFSVFGSVDPNVVVLNPSFDWFFIFFFFKYLFEEFVDVVFPSFSLVYRSLCWSYILNSDLGSIQQLFFNHLSLGDVALLSANFHFIFCVFCSSIESLHVPSCLKRQLCFF